MRKKDEDILISAMLQDLETFIPFLTKDYRRPKHLRPLVNALNDIIFTPQERHVLITVPPRHGKTETILHFIALYLLNNPTKTVGYTSYAQRQSESKTLKAQRYATRVNVEPDPKMQNRDEWRTKQGGGILTTGIGGPLTGQGLDVGIIDDPVKNREEAESEVYRDKNWRWFEDVYETRLEPGASSIVVMTRWHEDDLGGRIITNRPEYEIIRVPAIADGLNCTGKKEELDINGRQTGEALWPYRYNLEYFENIKNKKPFTFSALYQGLPTSREDRLFKEVYYYEELPEGLRYSSGLDLAYTEKTRADESAWVRMGMKEEKYYITDVETWQKDINYSKQHLKSIQARCVERFVTESNGPQKAICDMLEEFGINITRTNPTVEKYVRALEFIEAWNSRRVLLPKDKAWVNKFVDEVLNFTGIKDKKDNQVDAAVMAHDGLKENGVGFFAWG